MQIEYLSNEVALDALRYGTKMGKLKDKIMMKKSQTFPEAMAIATKLIDLIKVRREMRKKENEEKGIRRKEKKRDPKKENSSNRQRSKDKRYVPLNALRSEILIWIK